MYQIKNILVVRKVNLPDSIFSIVKSNIVKVNGFDEQCEYLGLDKKSDLEYSVKLLNLKFNSVINLRIFYLLHHFRTLESPNNTKIFEKLKWEGKLRNKYGNTKSFNND